MWWLLRLNPSALGAPIGALVVLWIVIIVLLPIFALCYLYILFVKFVKTKWNLSTTKSILLTLVCLFFVFNIFHYIEKSVKIIQEEKKYGKSRTNNKLFFSFMEEKK